MKLTSWLISFIILVVTFAPCKDDYVGQANRNPVISADAHSDGQHSSVLDSCSPFCACACCCSPSVVKQQAVPQTLATILKREYTDLYSGSIASAFIAVWQPPKLFS